MFDNPVFEAGEDLDAETRLFTTNEEQMEDRYDSVLIHNTLGMEPKYGKFNKANPECYNHQTAHSHVRSKRYETWPSPKTKRKRSQKSGSTSFSNADRNQYPVHCTDNRDVLDHPNSFAICRKCSSISLDGYSQAKNPQGHKMDRRVTYNVKDNRLKSSIRHHAMASVSSHSSASVDACAVEALSKEDLLVLWKRSEIELQTKLNRMLHQNRHLQQLVSIAEVRQRRNEEHERVDESLRHEGPCIISTRL